MTLLGSDDAVETLKALGEPTRLRIVALLSRGELTVSELCRILGQSQPRVSRHLRTLLDAGLVERQTEGTSAFYHLITPEPGADGGTSGLRRLAPGIVGLLADDPQRRHDLDQLDAIRDERSQAAARYFEEMAERWDSLGELYMHDARVEAAVTEAVNDHFDRPGRPGHRPGHLLDGHRSGHLLDVGTGTGRMLRLLGRRFERGTGVDLSSAMLRLARVGLTESGLDHCQVRQSNLYNLDLAPASVDVAVIHHVLHYLDRPGDALSEAAAALVPGGLVIAVDFAPHNLHHLLDDHAHHRAGIDPEEMDGWLRSAGLQPRPVRAFKPASSTDVPLTVMVWTADKPFPDPPQEPATNANAHQH